MTDIELYKGFLAIAPSSLPSVPFPLTDALTVIDKEKFLKALKGEIEVSIAFLEKQAPNPHPRHVSGALRAEIERVLSFVNPLAA